MRTTTHVAFIQDLPSHTITHRHRPTYVLPSSYNGTYNFLTNDFFLRVPSRPTFTGFDLYKSYVAGSEAYREK